jgi:two-component system cell cycle sensor histidine kinase/response regulator CckA
MARVVGRVSAATDGDQQGRVFSRRSAGWEVSQYAVLDASPNAVVAIDEQGRIVYANPQVETTFGYAHGEVIGMLVERLLPARLGERHVAHRNGFLAHPVARPLGIGLDLTGRRKDGTEFPVELSLAPVETADGMRAFATIVDISARKAAESQLSLAGGIAHDLNNMLFAIGGNAELLAQDLAVERRSELDTAGSLERVTAIMSAVGKAAELTDRLIASSRVDGRPGGAVHDAAAIDRAATARAAGRS